MWQSAPGLGPRDPWVATFEWRGGSAGRPQQRVTRQWSEGRAARGHLKAVGVPYRELDRTRIPQGCSVLGPAAAYRKEPDELAVEIQRWQANNEVHAQVYPMAVSNRQIFQSSVVPLGRRLRAPAKVAATAKLLDGLRHAGPPVLAGVELEGFRRARVPKGGTDVIGLAEFAAELSVIRDKETLLAISTIDPSNEHLASGNPGRCTFQPSSLVNRRRNANINSPG